MGAALVERGQTGLVHLDATELARLIREKAVSPREVVAAHLAQIDRVNPELNAVVTLADDLDEQAREAERALSRGDRIGPLHGVPFTVKDSLDTAGLRTTRGSRIFEDFVPDRDAVAVARLKDAGGIMLGKTNVPEFALWWETENLIFGRTVNPWDVDRTAGGSSGGEAAAIAAGLSPLGLGSDLGGSIRLPAHYCGAVGLKPTHGRVPLTGHFPATLLRYMHVGPLARSVRDAALALSLISGPDASDPSAPPVAPPPAMDADAGGRPLRIGALGPDAFGQVGRDVRAAVERALNGLAELGHEVEEVSLPGLELHDWNRRTTVIYLSEAAPYVEANLNGNFDLLHPFLQQRLRVWTSSFEDYLECEMAADQLRADTARALADHDVLVCPTAPVAAPPHGATDIMIDDEPFSARTSMRATIPFDLTGSPAICVPFGWSGDGLPISVQVVGRHFDESTVFRAAAHLEGLRESDPKPTSAERTDDGGHD